MTAKIISFNNYKQKKEEIIANPIKGINDEEGQAIKDALLQTIATLQQQYGKDNIKMSYYDLTGLDEDDTSNYEEGTEITAFEFMINNSWLEWSKDNLELSKKYLLEALAFLMDEIKEKEGGN